MNSIEPFLNFSIEQFFIVFINSFLDVFIEPFLNFSIKQFLNVFIESFLDDFIQPFLIELFLNF
jgi:hypothetical protein